MSYELETLQCNSFIATTLIICFDISFNLLIFLAKYFQKVNFLFYKFHYNKEWISLHPTHVIIYIQSNIMFSGLRRGLKSIDFYQAVPSELSQGTVSGACISVVSISILILLVTLTIINHLSPKFGSDLIIDHQHLDQKLRVNIDISFPRYPCSMLSLDVENILKVHQVNVGNTILKYNLPGEDLFTQSADRNQRKRRVQTDFNAGKGCRMKGWFQIDRVPGNFHFSCHGYSDVVQEFLNQGGYRQAHKTIDLSHIINDMWFGTNRYKYPSTLSNFRSQKQIGQAFLGISYTYFLDIVEFNAFNSINSASQDSYEYTVRMNEVILGSFPMVYFKYETNPITVLSYGEYQQWHVLFVKVVGIIGGIFTVATILDGMVHSSIHFLLQKHRLNKLR